MDSLSLSERRTEGNIVFRYIEIRNETVFLPFPSYSISYPLLRLRRGEDAAAAVVRLSVCVVVVVDVSV